MPNYIPVNTLFYSQATKKVLYGDGVTKFPETIGEKDTFITADYEFYYQKEFPPFGWRVEVKDRKPTYSTIPAMINGLPVVSLNGTFSGNFELTEAPEIPPTIRVMEMAFEGCTSLTKAPKIPVGVESMIQSFSGCTALTEPPILPNGLRYMPYTFAGCSALKQAPVVPSTVVWMNGAFRGCNSITGPLICNAAPIMSQEALLGSSITVVAGICSDEIKKELLKTKKAK